MESQYWILYIRVIRYFSFHLFPPTMSHSAGTGCTSLTIRLIVVDGLPRLQPNLELRLCFADTTAAPLDGH